MTNSKLRPLIAATCLFAGLPMMAQSAEKFEAAASLLPAAIAESGVLRIGMPDSGKPVAYMEDGALKGMDPDLAIAVAEVLGLKAEMTLISFDSAIPSLQSNKFDISFGEFYIKAERLKVVDFVTNWSDFSTFVVSESKDFNPTGLAEICGRTVGAMSATLDLEALQKAAEECGDNPATVNAYPSPSNAILALKSGRVDGVMIDGPQAAEAVKSNEGLAISGHFGGGPCATAVARNENSEQMREALKSAFDRLIETGEYAEILERHNTSYGAIEEAVIYTENSVAPDYGLH